MVVDLEALAEAVEMGLQILEVVEVLLVLILDMEDRVDLVL